MKIIIIGCGRIGSGLARQLSQQGKEVTVIDRDPLAFERLVKNFKGKTLVGVGFDRDVLLSAGIEGADAVAAVTASDEANVVIARLARQFFHVPRVAARIYEPRKAEIYRRFGLQTVSPSTIGVSRLAEILTFSNFLVEHSLGTGEVNLVEMEVKPSLSGRAVNMITVAGEISVVSITRNGKTFMPYPGSELQAGDLLHLAVDEGSLERVKELFG